MIRKIITVILVIAFAVGLYKITSKNPNGITNNGIDSNSADMIIYWGEGCPHCENVKKYIADNNIDSKLKISWKEVYQDKANQAEMAKTVQKCPEIDTSKGMGVPFGFSVKDEKCFVGDKPIIDWIEGQVSKQ